MLPTCLYFMASLTDLIAITLSWFTKAIKTHEVLRMFEQKQIIPCGYSISYNWKYTYAEIVSARVKFSLYIENELIDLWWQRRGCERNQCFCFNWKKYGVARSSRRDLLIDIFLYRSNRVKKHVFLTFILQLRKNLVRAK